MEKYSKWRDPGTGIQPFLHPKVYNLRFMTLHVIGVLFRNSLQEQPALEDVSMPVLLAQNYFAGPLLALIRLALLSVILTLAFILETLGMVVRCFYKIPGLL
jgi:hypothetical protein